MNLSSGEMRMFEEILAPLVPFIFNPIGPVDINTVCLRLL